MLLTLIRRRWTVLAAIVVVGGVVACSGGGAGPGASQGGATGSANTIEVDTAGIQYADRLVVYNGRSHYGDEQVFREFEERTGVEIELRGGTAPELSERLRQEGADTPADLLITTDLANLWRAEQAGAAPGGPQRKTRG